MWYDYNNVLSRNAMLNFILTNRGGGKTYGFKLKAINNFLKKGEQFVYVRRYKTELEDTVTFFNDIMERFPDHEFTCTKKYAFIDGKLAGYFIPLSTANNKKSTAYPKVTLICFDEFVIEKKNQRYLPMEAVLLNGLIETIVRKRDNVTVICIANNVTICNPHFEFWGIYPDFENGIRTYTNQDGERICVELNADEEFIEEKIKTRWGRLIKSTSYGKHSIYNESLTDNNDFIFDKKPQDSKFMFSFILNGNEVGVWNSGANFYCDKKIINTSPLRYVLQKEDLRPDYTLINRVNHSNLMYALRNAFSNGLVLYKDKYVKSNMYDVFKYIGIR